MRCFGRETCAWFSSRRRADDRGAVARGARCGFTLVEILMVVAVVAVLAAVLMPSSETAYVDQLRATAEIVRTDLAYARSLAVANNSHYRVSFDVDENRYVLEHVGTNAALDALPETAFRASDGPSDEQIVDLGELPRFGAAVEVVAVGAMGAGAQRVDHVEFGPLGETSRSEQTVVWLGIGQDDRRRYMWLRINPVTGLTEIGDCTTAPPPARLLAAAADRL